MSKLDRACMTKVSDTKKGTVIGFLLLDNDSVEFFNMDEESIGLVYTSSSHILFNDKEIGRIRLPFKDEPDTLKMVLYKEDGTEEVIDSHVSKNHVECYLMAESVFTKYLIDNDIISPECLTETINTQPII